SPPPRRRLAPPPIVAPPEPWLRRPPRPAPATQSAARRLVRPSCGRAARLLPRLRLVPWLTSLPSSRTFSAQSAALSSPRDRLIRHTAIPPGRLHKARRPLCTCRRPPTARHGVRPAVILNPWPSQTPSRRRTATCRIP